MPISTIDQTGLSAPLSLTSPVIAGTPTGVGVLTSGTAVASTSGVAIDFTSIPSWAKRITVMLYGVSTTGTSNYLIQVGAGSITTSGYVAGSMSGGTYVSSTAGLILVNNIVAADLFSGILVLTNVTGNTWVSISNMNKAGSPPAVLPAAGNIVLGGTLDRIRLTTVNGTDTFDAGSINILYE